MTISNHYSHHPTLAGRVQPLAQNCVEGSRAHDGGYGSTGMKVRQHFLEVFNLEKGQTARVNPDHTVNVVALNAALLRRIFEVPESPSIKEGVPVPNGKLPTGRIVRSGTGCVVDRFSVCDVKSLRSSGSATRLLIESLTLVFCSRFSENFKRNANNFTSKFVSSMRRSALTILKFVDPLGGEQSYMKFHLDSLLGRIFEDGNPPPANNLAWKEHPLFTGLTMRLIRRAIARRDLTFIYSLQKGAKQFWPELSKEKCLETYKKHYDRMTSPKTHLSSGYQKILYQTAQEIFISKKIPYTVPFALGWTERSRLAQKWGSGEIDMFSQSIDDLLWIVEDASGPASPKFLPTSSSCLQSPYGFGALSLADFMGNPRLTMDVEGGYERSPEFSERFQKEYEAFMTEKKLKLLERPSYIIPKLGYLPTLIYNVNSWRQRNFDKFAYSVLRDCEDPETDTPIDRVNIVAVPEPGKFRIVSLGHGYLYSILQPLQGELLNSWKSSHFSTMRYDDLTQRVTEMYLECTRVSSEMYFMSVDYEAATDLLKKEVSRVALAPLAGHPLFNISMVSLGSTSLSYPKDFYKKYPGIPRDARSIEGQLMGHPLSFPLLCVANLAALKYALAQWVSEGQHESRREFKRRRNIYKVTLRTCLVNGDDMLFMCEKSFVKFFDLAIQHPGFKISVGKNFFSPHSCQINSQVFRISDKGDRMVRFGYLNLRLVSGKGSKRANTSDTDSVSKPTEVGPAMNKMLSRCSWGKGLIPMAFDRWKSDWLGKVRPNWYLPVHLGGFGVDIRYSPPTFNITRQQRLLAASYVADPTLCLYRNRFVYGLKMAKMVGATARYTLVPEDYTLREGDVTVGEEEDPWMARACMGFRMMHHSISQTTDKVLYQKVQYRFSPMSEDGLLKYWRGRLVCTGQPPCPPMPLSLSKASAILTLAADKFQTQRFKE